MQENWLQLTQNFNITSRFVLATICATKGSTYRKTGTMMLIADDGTCTGLLSGGCLEADISLHAQQVINDNIPMIISYDLKADSELLWGLGLGCDGAIDILLQPLTPENDHLGFGQVISAVNQRKLGVYCQSVSHQQPAFGAFITDSSIYNSIYNSIDNSIGSSIDNSIENYLSESTQHYKEIDSLLIVPITPPLSIVICGAGPDVEPVVQILLQMGWQVTLWDHRRQHLEQVCFSTCQKKQIRPEHITSQDFLSFDAVVIMTHNLENDSYIVEQAWQSTLSYIGILGPVGRRNKLIKPMKLNENNIQGRLYGPIGLDLGGQGPQAIALSIAAQIQQHFSEILAKSNHTTSYIYDVKK